MWNEGYVTSLAYTAGYYSELNPSQIRLALLHAGLRPLPSRPLRYLELGFGQGLSLAIHAASNEGEFWGTDFNPAHAGAAADLVSAAGCATAVLEQSFAEIAARTDLPEFDVIALHGIWSWISEPNQRAIVELARRKLATGGVFYVSYNCWPGHAPNAPLQHLFMLHSRFTGREGDGLPAHVDAAIAFADELRTAKAAFFEENPKVGKAFDLVKTRDRRYVAHEYFNDHWQPLPFSAVAQQLDGAKLSFAASASLLDHFDRLQIREAGLQILSPIKERIFRESVRDYLTNAQFRRDYFLRGPRRLSTQEQMDGFRDLRVVLDKPAADIELKARTALGELNLNRRTFDPLIEVLASRGHGPVAWRELEQAVAGRLSLQQLRDATVILVGLGHLHVAQGEREVERVRAPAGQLRDHLIEKATAGGDYAYLPSPVTGGGIRVNRTEQWFVAGLAAGAGDAPALARRAWAALSRVNQRLTKDGKALETETDNLAELESQAATFLAKRLDPLKALGIVAA